MRLNELRPFGVEILDFKADAASDAELAAFADAFRKYSWVRIHDPDLTAQGQLRLMERIGPVVIEAPGGSNVNYVANDPTLPAEANAVGRGELQFHFDQVWSDDWPFHAISLFAEETPSSGGETRFCHGGVGWRGLSPRLQAKVRGRRAVHIFDPYLPPDSPKLTEDMMSTYAERAVHDMVKPHPFHDEEVLALAYINADRVVGLPAGESRALLDEVFAALYRPHAVYAHDWRVGDIVVWDNRVVQHARGDFDPRERRRLRRVSVGDEVSIQRRVRRWMEQLPADHPLAAGLANSLPGDGKRELGLVD